MNQTLSAFLDQIRGLIKISDLISEETQVIRKGRTVKALCPFHNEKTPSFSINDEQGIYHCFGCGASGDHFSFVMNTKNMEFMEACEHLANKLNLKLPNTFNSESNQNSRLIDLCEKTCSWYQEQLLRNTGEKAREYLEKRNIKQQSIENFKIGFAPQTGLLKFLKEIGFSEQECIDSGVAVKVDSKIYERFKNRIMFPICSIKGQVIAFGGRVLDKSEPKYLNSPETDIFKKRYVLYGFDKARKHMRKQAIVVEGYMDVIRLHQEGLPIAVAPLGTALTVEQLQQLWKFAPNPILAFDGDNAGANAAFNTLEKILPYIKAEGSLKFLLLPKTDDPDSFVMREGIEKFKNITSFAKAIYEMIWEKATENYDLFNISPEDFVSLKNLLKGYLKAIKHKDLQKAYINKFDGLLNSLQKQNFSEDSAKKTKKFAKPLIEKKISKENILMVTLLNHPHIWKSVSEAFTNLTFENDTVEKERLAIVEYFFEKDDFSENTWPNSCDELKKVADKEFYARVPFAKIGYDLKKVESGWWEVYASFTGLSLQNDQLVYADHLKNNLTSSNWERLKALKKTLT